MAASKPLAVISGVARTHAIGRAIAGIFLDVSLHASILLAIVVSTGQAATCMQAGYKVLGLDAAPQEDPALQHADYQFAAADISDAEQVAKIAERVSNAGGLQVLINNAGIADPFLPESPDRKVQHWNKVIQTNLTGISAKCMLLTLEKPQSRPLYVLFVGAFLLSEALLPHMPPGKSSIIHMSSIRARQSEPNTEVHVQQQQASVRLKHFAKYNHGTASVLTTVPIRMCCMQAYGAAKAGLVGLTHAQAVTLANKVRVNAVLPGWIYTEENPDELTKQDHEWHLSGEQSLSSLSTLQVVSA